MAAYAAISSFRHANATFTKAADCFLPPSLAQIVEFVDKELKSIQEFVQRLDSSSRKRMNASLRQMAAATCKFQEEFYARIGRPADEDEFVDKELKSIQEFVQRFDSSSRKRMNASLQQMAAATCKFQEEFYARIGRPADEDEFVDLKQETHSFVEMLRKTVVEYYDESASSSRLEDVPETKMVGLSDVYNEVKVELAVDLWGNTVLLLVGMAGIGKTTLARKIFEDLDILEWFDCRIWVTVGRNFDWEKIEQTIVAQVNPDAKNLGESLRGKRYLIVLDDVWNVEIENYYTSFPNNIDGSRILLTTRIRFCPKADDMLRFRRINMRLLDEEESWLLLCDKVFGQDLCPLELEKAGKQIAEKCDGLPLTIVTVAEHLLKAQVAPELLWAEVAFQKKHQLFTDAYDEISKVLYPSYDWLPQELKRCFLYVGIFPQNFEIPRSKLTNLWVAEDIIEVFLELTESYTLEESALLNIKFLAFYSFVMIYKKSSTSFELINDRIKTCGLHSSWWHFSQREARKINFFHILECYEDGLGEAIKCQSRLSIHNNVLFAIKDVNNSIEENCASTAYSLLCLGPYLQYQLPICFGLKLLQKLDALNIRFYKFPIEVLELVKLQYLALTFNGKVPPCISKLLKLQFLIINRQFSIKSNGSPTYLPMEIWDLIELKYLEVMGCDIPDLGGTCLPNLLTISGVSNDSCTKGIFERILKLKKLGIRIELEPNDTEPLCCFNHISLLDELESLKCVIVNPICKPEVVTPLIPLSNFPLKLKKLNLSGMGYLWEDMSKIASLPCLEELKLRSNAFRGPKWEIKENEFKNLYILLIEDIDLVQLEGRDGSLQKLLFLSLKHCYKLKEVCLTHCKILWKIEVVDCNPLAVTDIKKNILECERWYLMEKLSVHSSWTS